MAASGRSVDGGQQSTPTAVVGVLVCVGLLLQLSGPGFDIVTVGNFKQRAFVDNPAHHRHQVSRRLSIFTMEYTHTHSSPHSHVYSLQSLAGSWHTCFSELQFDIGSFTVPYKTNTVKRVAKHAAVCAYFLKYVIYIGVLESRSA